ncbi:MAG: thioredoxin family protein, partial [Candidatus Moraniibacteriota bacterium]
GCPNCQKLEAYAKQAMSELGLSDVKIDHITDIAEITQYGVMSTPAIVVHEEIKAAGRIPEIQEIKQWLKQ